MPTILVGFCRPPRSEHPVRWSDPAVSPPRCACALRSACPGCLNSDRRSGTSACGCRLGSRTLGSRRLLGGGAGSCRTVAREHADGCLLSCRARAYGPGRGACRRRTTPSRRRRCSTPIPRWRIASCARPIRSGSRRTLEVTVAVGVLPAPDVRYGPSGRRSHPAHDASRHMSAAVPPRHPTAAQLPTLTAVRARHWLHPASCAGGRRGGSRAAPRHGCDPDVGRAPEVVRNCRHELLLQEMSREAGAGTRLVLPCTPPTLGAPRT